METAATFLLGRSRYTSGGIMDSTHYRFYDWNTASHLVSNSGYQILSRKSDGILPLSHLLGPVRQVVDKAALSLLPGFLGNQFILTANKLIARK